jgi:hypothetical protein
MAKSQATFMKKQLEKNRQKKKNNANWSVSKILQVQTWKA